MDGRGEEERLTDHAAAGAGAPPDVESLVQSLQRVASAFDQARASGLGVSVPESLYAACLEIVNRHGFTGGPTGGNPPGGGRQGREPSLPATPTSLRRDRRVDMEDIPLRRLVWQVVNPGEEFTVADVSARLAALGTPRPATAVSNALGYWASRDRLARVRKGTYSYLRPDNAPGGTSHDDRQQEGPAARSNRAPKAQGEENGDVTISRARKAAS
jgi:hypothetical protein